MIMPKNRFYQPQRAHHTPRGFQNPEPIEIKQSDVLKWQKERTLNGYPHPPKVGYEAFQQQWWQPADFNVNHDAVWWLGHATVLFKVGQQTILTDPVFSKRSSPVAFAGPARRVPPAATIEQLPNIDIVVISHDHYDHLDLPSLKALVKRNPGLHILVPLGLKSLLEHAVIKLSSTVQVTEMDWWDNIQLGDSLITFVPAQHWSARGILDRNATLWGGWMIHHNQRNLYFMGDSAYSSHLQEIYLRLGEIDLATIPIGAYAPRWMMQSQHIDPEQAVQLHLELHCKQSVAIHWGAFELANEPLDEPPEYLTRVLQQQQLDPDCFKIIKMGAYLAI